MFKLHRANPQPSSKRSRFRLKNPKKPLATNREQAGKIGDAFGGKLAQRAGGAGGGEIGCEAGGCRARRRPAEVGEMGEKRRVRETESEDAEEFVYKPVTGSTGGREWG